MSDLQNLLKAARKVDAKATKGTWIANVTPPGPCGQVMRSEAVVVECEKAPGLFRVASCGEKRGAQWYHDAQAIARSRNLFAALLDVAEAAGLVVAEPPNTDTRPDGGNETHWSFSGAEAWDVLNTSVIALCKAMRGDNVY